MKITNVLRSERNCSPAHLQFVSHFTVLQRELGFYIYKLIEIGKEVEDSAFWHQGHRALPLNCSSVLISEVVHGKIYLLSMTCVFFPYFCGPAEPSYLSSIYFWLSIVLCVEVIPAAVGSAF